MAAELLLMAQSLRRRGPILVLGLQRAAVVEGPGTMGAACPLRLPVGAGTDQAGQLPERKGHAPG